MEVVIWTILITIWWITSYSILLPIFLVLYFNKTIRYKWFALFYSHVAVRVFNPNMHPMRVKAFELLKKQLSERNKKDPLQVLEVGVGPALNLNLYPDNINLSVLDVNKEFEKYILAQSKKFPGINYGKTFINSAEDMKDIEDDSFDVVVSTFLLCSVGSVESSVKEIKRILKPGGMYLFLEHVAFETSATRYFIQKFANPLWKIYINGCCLDRNPEAIIRKTGFRQVHCESLCPEKVLIFIRPVIMGIATK